MSFSRMINSSFTIWPLLSIAFLNPSSLSFPTLKLSIEESNAIFALNEVASTIAFKLVLKKGYKIPDEISIIGFADGVWSKRLTPSLSTVSQHAPEIGKNAANLLIDRLEDKSKKEIPEYKTIVIKTELRQRESTRKF